MFYGSKEEVTKKEKRRRKWMLRDFYLQKKNSYLNSNNTNRKISCILLYFNIIDYNDTLK